VVPILVSSWVVGLVSVLQRPVKKIQFIKCLFNAQK
jgi:hypothetical protein